MTVGDPELDYQVVYDMVRDRRCVANVLTTSSGRCVVSWPTSVIVYESEADARMVHIEHMGRCGESTKFVPVWSDGPSFMRGVENCCLDAGENAPFGVFGGPDKRDQLVAPDWEGIDSEDFIRGYIAQAQCMYGPDWQTCSFSWGPALEIGEAGDE